MSDVQETVRSVAEGVLLSVLVSPRASRTEITGIHDGMCKIRVKAAPVDGAANKALKDGLAKIFAIPKNSVILEKGLKGKRKVFKLVGLTAEQVCNIIDSNIKGNQT